MSKTALNIHEAAQVLVQAAFSTHDAEVALAQAIEHGELHANVKRWASEQWAGKQLPGNIVPVETFIERTDLNAWLAAKGLGVRAD
ncbi:hypothetical protein OTERR_10090 [Oryzomicrobium terrae]|uniref:Uncharacterized protein n=1 Tax=Oryzomicrobium terrae TaxID=1735038 RepID=A0A5C1E724_9RHOO|nr:hypothetical protein [Oryzomicrobium terrae]QEL64485.1 hypothetical protein OTERR_10090 [Oryzomicrobium terrae]